jgi:hypothetical protein
VFLPMDRRKVARTGSGLSCTVSVTVTPLHFTDVEASRIAKKILISRAKK